MDSADVFAVIQDWKKLNVASIESMTVDPAAIFDALEESCRSKELAEKVLKGIP